MDNIKTLSAPLGFQIQEFNERTLWKHRLDFCVYYSVQIALE